MIEFRMPWRNESGEGHRRIAMARDRLQWEKEQGISGYYHLPETEEGLIERVETMARDGLPREVETLAVIGIGGSSLGAKAIDRALRVGRPDVKELLFLENTDPLDIAEKFARIDRERTLFLLISKSGGTIETLSIFRAAVAHFDLKIAGRDRRRIWVVTDEGSPLWSFARHYDLEHFAVPSNVGGRFSVLSAVGLVPLTLAGYDTRSLLKGAAAYGRRFWSDPDDPLLHKALFLAEHRERYPMNVLFAYGSCLEDLSAWYVQLWGESLGKISKSGERRGLTPLGQIGSVDQHSFLQLIVQGPLDKTVTFLKVKEFGRDLPIPALELNYLESSAYVEGSSLGMLLEAECDATYESVRRHGVPTDMIVLDRLDEEHLGELIYHYELLTSATAAILEVDPYDQPGVEEGKQILKEKFRQISGTKE